VVVLAPPPGGASAGAPGEPPGRAPSGPEDAQAEALINATLAALQQNRDPALAARAAIPYLHKSLLDASRTELSADSRAFSFKKAHGSASAYGVPVRITRVRESRVTAIGHAETGERGRSVDYFVAKRDGVAGMPAPVTVFFPEGGGPAKICYLGSL